MGDWWTQPLDRLNAECDFDLARICFKVVVLLSLAFLLDPSPSSLCLVSHFVSLTVLLLRLDWRNPGVWRVTQPLQKSHDLSKSHKTSPCLTSCFSFDSHVDDIGTKQKPCCWWRNKTEVMLLMPDENKSHFFHVGAKPKALLLKLKQNKSMVTNIFTISHLIYGILY